MEIKLNDSILSYQGYFIKSINSTEYNERVKYDLIRHSYQLELQINNEKNDNNGKIIIGFTADTANLIPDWVQYHFSKEKREIIRKETPYLDEMHGLLHKSETHLKVNIERLRKLFVNDDFFGKNIFQLDQEEIVNHTYSINIQYLEIWNSKELTYLKKGVSLDNEKPMIISEYRHLLEWIPEESKIKLINLGIISGQKYATQSRPFTLVELNYSEDNPFIKWGNQIDTRHIKVDEFYRYVFQGTESTKISNRVYRMLKREIESK